MRGRSKRHWNIWRARSRFDVKGRDCLRPCNPVVLKVKSLNHREHNVTQRKATELNWTFDEQLIDGRGRPLLQNLARVHSVSQPNQFPQLISLGEKCSVLSDLSAHT